MIALAHCCVIWSSFAAFVILISLATTKKTSNPIFIRFLRQFSVLSIFLFLTKRSRKKTAHWPFKSLLLSFHSPLFLRIFLILSIRTPLVSEAMWWFPVHMQIQTEAIFPSKGTEAPFTICLKFKPEIETAVNRLYPNGGVTNPTTRQIQNSIPMWSSLHPSAPNRN